MDEIIYFLNALEDVLRYINLDYTKLTFYAFIGFIAFITALIFLEEPLSIMCSNINAWDMQNRDELIRTFYGTFVKYFSNHIPNWWAKQRNFVYFYITSEKLQFMMDTFLSPNLVCSEIEDWKWKRLFLRGCVYHFAVIYPEISYKLIRYYFLSMFIRIVYEQYLSYRYPFENSFDFNALPFTIQQRFYELQEPLMKTRIISAYSYSAKFPNYKELTVDRLYIRKADTCHKIYYNFSYQKLQSQPYKKILSLCSGLNKTKCKCSFKKLKKVKIIHEICAKYLVKNTLLKYIRQFEYSTVKKLVLMECNLGANDFSLIKQMKLNSFILFMEFDVDMTFYDKMIAILEEVIGIPHLRFRYYRECENPDEFEIYLVEWVLTNGYIESIVCISETDENATLFQSSLSLEPTDTN